MPPQAPLDEGVNAQFVQKKADIENDLAAGKGIILHTIPSEKLSFTSN